MLWIISTIASTFAAYIMAESRNRDVRWAIVGGLVFGWFCPLYYLIFVRKPKAFEVDTFNPEK
jgi:hypothetical protein